MRIVTVAGAWTAASALALYNASHTKVGAVLASIGTRHGLHVGDVAGFVVAYAWATVISLALLGNRPR